MWVHNYYAPSLHVPSTCIAVDSLHYTILTSSDACICDMLRNDCSDVQPRFGIITRQTSINLVQFL